MSSKTYDGTCIQSLIWVKRIRIAVLPISDLRSAMRGELQDLHVDSEPSQRHAYMTPIEHEAWQFKCYCDYSETTPAMEPVTELFLSLQK